MKKRLISMLMAVLMIASLLPASVVLAEETTACMHRGDVTEVSVKKDRAKKVAGVEAVICNDCGAILKSKDVRTVSADGVTITPFALFGITCNKCKNPVTVEVQAAGCGTAGLTVSYCADCGKAFNVKELAGKDGKETYYKAEAALEHFYDDFHVEVAPTCKVDGWGYVLCKNCGDPLFVADAEDAVDKLEPGNYANAAAYQKRYGEVHDLFVKTNPTHADTKLVTVTSEITGFVDNNGNTVTLTPARDYEHANTISGVYSATEGKVVAASKTSNVQKYEASVTGTTVTFTPKDALGAVVSRTADKYCASCHEVFAGQEKTTEKHETLGTTPTEVGYAPYIDKYGYPHDGKTDVWKCATCNKPYGGVRLDFDEYFNFSDTESLKADKYSVSNIVIPGKLVTCHSDGLTDTVLAFDKSAGKWTVKEVGVAVTKRPAHNMVSGTAVDPDCKNGIDGKIYKNYKYCANEGCTDYEGDPNAIVKIPAKHDWVKTPIVPATCKSAGIQVEKCSKCNSYKTNADGSIDKTILPKVDKHVASDKLANVKEATCTEEGYTGDVVCKFCGEVMKPGEKTEMVDHTPVDVEAKAPTCTEPGVTKGTVCSVCKKVLSAQETVPALGHDPKLVNAKDATCTEAGYTGDKVCTRCNVTLEKGKDTKALGHNFVKGVCSRCDAKQPGYNPFSDVKAGPYYDAILWAYENGVAAGKADGTFGVNNPCIRAQIVTFLWRAAGEPIAKNAVNPFSDVSAKSPYYNAILWAVENGITAGTTATTFSPNAPCTRAQIVTFLWRYENKPIVSTLAKFDDVSESSVYYNAIMWAVETGITSGVTKTTFAPNDTCTRGQAVTFIYREFASK